VARERDGWCNERIAASKAVDAARDQTSRLKAAHLAAEAHLEGWTNTPALQLLRQAAAGGVGGPYSSRAHSTPPVGLRGVGGTPGSSRGRAGVARPGSCSPGWVSKGRGYYPPTGAEEGGDAVRTPPRQAAASPAAAGCGEELILEGGRVGARGEVLVVQEGSSPPVTGKRGGRRTSAGLRRLLEELSQCGSEPQYVASRVSGILQSEVRQPAQCWSAARHATHVQLKLDCASAVCLASAELQSPGPSPHAQPTDTSHRRLIPRADDAAVGPAVTLVQCHCRRCRARWRIRRSSCPCCAPPPPAP
jgi:hypothetical protein